jgi:hypothetical protein
MKVGQVILSPPDVGGFTTGKWEHRTLPEQDPLLRECFSSDSTLLANHFDEVQHLHLNLVTNRAVNVHGTADGVGDKPVQLSGFSGRQGNAARQRGFQNNDPSPSIPGSYAGALWMSAWKCQCRSPA